MPLFVKAPIQHVKELNQRNDALATLADLEFGTPVPTTDAEKTQFSNKNSKVVIKGVGAKYYGQQTVYYNRLNLSSAFANQALLLELLTPATSLYTQLEEINSQLATDFDQSDLEDVVIASDPSEGVLVLTAKEGSYGWIGSTSIAYQIIDPYLIEIPDANLDGVMTPNESTNLEQAALRYSFWDFHLNRAFIDTLVVGDLSTADAQTLKDIFATIDSTAWQTTGAGNYSLEGAKILYNGTAGEWATSRLFKNVLVIELSASSTLLTGRLYLHYNDSAEA